MVLKGYVKRVADLKKKSKEQLINYIIERERRREDKLGYLVNRVDSLNYLLEEWKRKNCECKIEIAILQTLLEVKEKENAILIGEIKFKEKDLYNAYEIISNHSKNIEKETLKIFKQIKSNMIQELVDEKIRIVKEALEIEKENDIIGIFEHLGVSKERLNEIIFHK